MLLEEKTAALMRSMAESALSGGTVEIPGVKAERASVYRDLVWNAFQDTLQRAFPLAKAAVNDHWSQMVERFVASGPKTSPLLWKMPQEFVHFVKEQKFAEHFGLPWLDEMLAFEWMEIELYMMADLEVPKGLQGFPAEGKGRVVLNPVSEVQAYQYPVFLSIDPDKLAHPGKYFLLAFRHRETNKVHFVEISAEVVLVLERLSEVSSRLDEVLEDLQLHQGIEVDRERMQKSLDELCEIGMILGTEQGDA